MYKYNVCIYKIHAYIYINIWRPRIRETYTSLWQE